MQTYSHLIMTAVIDEKLKLAPPAGLPSTNRWLLIGSVAPDLPLTLLTILFVVSDIIARWRDPLNSQREGYQTNSAWLFGDLFFNNGWVKFIQSLFHGPILILAYVGIGYGGWMTGRSWGGKLFWFGIGCLLHTAIDIPVHHDDGPLLLYPFDSKTRFRSPVSYWDPKRYGRPFAIAEHLLNLLLLIYLSYLRWGVWWQQKATA